LGRAPGPLFELALLQSLQLSLFFRNALVQILAFELCKLSGEQPSVALNSPPMTKDFGGPEVNHRRHLAEMERNSQMRVASSPPNRGSVGEVGGK
jgi:hypothetical protein